MEIPVILISISVLKFAMQLLSLALVVQILIHMSLSWFETI